MIWVAAFAVMGGFWVNGSVFAAAGMKPIPFGDPRGITRGGSPALRQTLGSRAVAADRTQSDLSNLSNVRRSSLGDGPQYGVKLGDHDGLADMPIEAGGQVRRNLMFHGIR